MWFAAKEAHERKVAERRRREALATEGRREALPKEPRDRFQEGFRQGFLDGFRQGREDVRREERERISRALAEHGVTLPPQVARILSDGSDT